MAHTDLRLKFQRESGHGLDTINHMAGNGDSEYVEWLEEELSNLHKQIATLKGQRYHTPEPGS